MRGRPFCKVENSICKSFSLKFHLLAICKMSGAVKWSGEMHCQRHKQYFYFFLIFSHFQKPSYFIHIVVLHIGWSPHRSFATEVQKQSIIKTFSPTRTPDSFTQLGRLTRPHNSSTRLVHPTCEALKTRSHSRLHSGIVHALRCLTRGLSTRGA